MKELNGAPRLHVTRKFLFAIKIENIYFAVRILYLKFNNEQSDMLFKFLNNMILNMHLDYKIDNLDRT